MLAHVEPFWGNKPGENARDFIHSFNRAMGDKDDAFKAKQFENYLRADSEADEWWNELEDDKKGKWSDIEVAFKTKWPGRTVVKKTPTEYEEELLGLKLKVEDLGVKEEVGGREAYKHILWAEHMAKLAKGAGVEAGSTYVGQVIKGLPKIIRRKVAGTYETWDEFLKAVKDVDMAYVKEGVEEYMREKKEKDAMEARLKVLESMLAQGVTALTQQMSTMSMGGGQQHIGGVQVVQPRVGGGRGGFTGGRASPANGPRPPPKPVMPELQARMRASLAAITHHPDTAEGRKAHMEQQLEWAKKHGAAAWVTEDTPYPLRPGTAPVCSGECYRCGMRGHRGAECVVPREGQLIRNEQAWRAVCARVLGGQQAVSVQWVATSDYGTKVEVMMVEGEQGNEDGSSA
ncbi:hypothetical protein FA13DRAFT_761470 [Coprinellus micaceus]|uniref:CCHC-type domain-containing protein n=1 Tax=Coprinellus micaceus TaxID=71717 RepID=A0A4Y7T4I0_COPMI|nr:hypothetical protein FA13DRAFT_761470 [Coprinellus micaceus]